MLVPAICYKEELLKQFSKELYTEKYFYYSGMGHDHVLPKLDDDSTGTYKWAIVADDGEVAGYFAYRIYLEVDSVENFGLYMFDTAENSLTRNAILLREGFNKLEELINEHHRVSWRVIEGNPIVPSYDKFCKTHNGHKVELHDVTIDNNGKYHDEYIYEIVKGQGFDG